MIDVICMVVKSPHMRFGLIVIYSFDLPLTVSIHCIEDGIGM